jgi:hypothetical protein
MTDHADATELALFVRGELEGSQLASFEAHVSSCAACAALLTREARLELALLELGARGELAAPAGRRVLARRLVGATLTLGVAAGLVLTLWPPRESARPGSRSIPGVVCAQGAEQAACVKRAHDHGLFVRYPTWAGPPPLGGIAVGHSAPDDADPRRQLGPSGPPFAVHTSEL